jgi:hypothetical protein
LIRSNQFAAISPPEKTPTADFTLIAATSRWCWGNVYLQDFLLGYTAEFAPPETKTTRRSTMMTPDFWYGPHR